MALSSLQACHNKVASPSLLNLVFWLQVQQPQENLSLTHPPLYTTDLPLHRGHE